MKTIKVIIVDDSILIQKMLISILNNDHEIVVVGAAENPNIAREIIKILNPDVLILDVEMPEMDGLTFLEKIMRLRPMPVLMCSSFTPQCKEVTLEAFKLGVVDIISKPILPCHYTEIIDKVRNAANAKLKKYIDIESGSLTHIHYHPNRALLDQYVLAIGASTGGTEALKLLFRTLPANLPPIVVTQHLPESFGALFAERSNQNSKLTITLAKDGEKLKSGHVYIAPSGYHLEIVKNCKQLFIKLDKSEQNCSHIPSVDVMMKSVASIMKDQSMAILLTGMGSDGAQGMVEIQNKGGITIAQDEASSVVWGMPRAAVELGAAKYVLPLQKIPEIMLSCINKLSS